LLSTGDSRVVAEEPAINGKWKVISTKHYGKDVPNEVGVIWEFQDEKHLVIHHNNGMKLEGRYQLDTDKKPWQLEIETADDRPNCGGGGPRKGIVSIEGDGLKLCVTGSAAVPRPAEMVSKEGTLNILRVMKRVKDTE
jgi:uncharacterized protein (TIGR03067 family)